MGKSLPSRNNYFSLLARRLETVHALERAADLLEKYVPPLRSRCRSRRPRASAATARKPPAASAGTSIAATPTARSSPPDHSADQPELRHDRGRLKEMAPHLSELPDEEASLRCEHLIRNYDPCISCSVHFLRFSRRAAMSGDCPLLVAAFGNDMAADDAFGPLVAEALRAMAPAGVEVVNLGMRPAALLDHLAGRAALCVVDAARGAGLAEERSWTWTFSTPTGRRWSTTPL